MLTTYTADRIYTGLSPDLLESGAVTVADEEIVYVGPAANAPNSQIVDLGDVTLLPGLIDMHVHLTLSGSETAVEDYLSDTPELRLLRGAEALRRALAAGITTVRECGGQNTEVFALREASQRRLLPAPRVIAAGGSITITGGHCWFFGLEADGELEVRQAVRRQIKAGADYIKVMATGGAITPRSNPIASQYTYEELAAIVTESSSRGLRVAAHCHGTAGVADAARAMVTTIEHCSFQTPTGLIYDEQVAQQVKDAGCYVCPTLAIAERASQSLPVDHRIAFYRREIAPQRFRNLRHLAELGIPFISGSDAGVTLTPIEDFAYNLTLLVDEVGLTPHAALQSATVTAAAALGRTDLGALEPGRAADLLAVAGNPLNNIHDLWQVLAVVARGVRYR
jgi:imidazolonepropionase-like amidohydrolase